MSQQNVYIVFGEAGQYSDHVSWTVAAYFDKEQADLHAEKAKQWAKYLWDNLKDEKVWERRRRTLNPWDDGLGSSDLDDVGYGVQEVPLFYDISFYRLSKEGDTDEV